MKENVAIFSGLLSAIPFLCLLFIFLQPVILLHSEIV
jgi:hypothetical protein